MTEEHKSFTVVLPAVLIRQIRAAAALADKKIPEWVKAAMEAELRRKRRTNG